jgi:hypothetical protein
MQSKAFMIEQATCNNVKKFNIFVKETMSKIDYFLTDSGQLVNIFKSFEI